MPLQVIRTGDYLPQCAELLMQSFGHFPSKKELWEFIEERTKWGHYVCDDKEIAARVAFVNYDLPDLEQAYIDYECARIIS